MALIIIEGEKTLRKTKMKNNLTENTLNNAPTTLHISRSFVTSLAIAITALCISPDGFAEEIRNNKNSSMQQTRMVAGFARVNEEDRSLEYGAKFITRMPEISTLTSTTRRAPVQIKMVAGRLSNIDDCSTTVEVRNLANGRKVAETTQKCIRTDISLEDIEFLEIGSTIAFEFGEAKDASDVYIPTSAANFISVSSCC